MSYRKDFKISVTANKLNQKQWERFADLLNQSFDDEEPIQGNCDNIKLTDQGMTCEYANISGSAHAAVAILDEYCGYLDSNCEEVEFEVSGSSLSTLEKCLSICNQFKLIENEDYNIGMTNSCSTHGDNELSADLRLIITKPTSSICIKLAQILIETSFKKGL